jgi:hypothetical protein
MATEVPSPECDLPCRKRALTVNERICLRRNLKAEIFSRLRRLPVTCGRLAAPANPQH